MFKELLWEVILFWWGGIFQILIFLMLYEGLKLLPVLTEGLKLLSVLMLIEGLKLLPVFKDKFKSHKRI
jgi:hypothetical protein